MEGLLKSFIKRTTSPAESGTANRKKLKIGPVVKQYDGHDREKIIAEEAERAFDVSLYSFGRNAELQGYLRVFQPFEIAEYQHLALFGREHVEAFADPCLRLFVFAAPAGSLGEKQRLDKFLFVTVFDSFVLQVVETFVLCQPQQVIPGVVRLWQPRRPAPQFPENILCDIFCRSPVHDEGVREIEDVYIVTFVYTFKITVGRITPPRVRFVAYFHLFDLT